MWILFGKGRPAAFLFFLNVFTFVALVLTPEAGGSHHMMAIYPFPHYFAAAVLAQLSARFASTRNRRFTAAAVMTVAIAVVIVSNLRTVHAHYSAYLNHQINSRWTDQTYALVEYLRDHKDHPTHLYDWGMRHSVLFLTRGEIELGEPYWSVLQDPDFPAQFDKKFPEPRALYVLHTQEATTMKAPRDWFMERAKPKLAEGLLREQAIGDGSTFVVYETVRHEERK